VFDRIRENVPLMRTATYRQIVNRSVHETLTRSIITSVTTLLPVAVLYLFGGDTLKDFAFALLVGILSGGLSSIAIAAPLAALWKEREPQGRKREARQAKKRRRIENIDSDVVDVTVLERAEAALDARIAEEERVDEYHGLTLEPEEEPQPEPERRGRATTPRADNGGAPETATPAAPAEAPPNGPAPEPEEAPTAQEPAAQEPAAQEPVGAEPAAEEPGEEPAPSQPAAPAQPPRPERVRRHRQVQRKKGGKR
jgi:SecD/SecF fusion protein